MADANPSLPLLPFPRPSSPPLFPRAGSHLMAGWVAGWLAGWHKDPPGMRCRLPEATSPARGSEFLITPCPYPRPRAILHVENPIVLVASRTRWKKNEGGTREREREREGEERPRHSHLLLFYIYICKRGERIVDQHRRPVTSANSRFTRFRFRCVY